jgi:D-arabinose 1-dehydrogenase-like Zn-dependent alcohol dehydrogenase
MAGYRQTRAVTDTMRAARFHASSRQLVVEDVPVPEPGPNEVLVTVQACGICLSDVHLIDGSLPGPLPVVTPGHESAGVVARVGAQVSGWQPGDRVLLAGGRPCGTCRHCVRGRYQDCLAFEIMGFNYDGAWAQYVVVPAQMMTSIPDDLPFPQAAVLADAVSTPYAALTARAELHAGESIGLWGIGGLGVHAVQIARLVGASPVIAVDPLASARERALAVGADVALDPTSEDVVERIREITDGEMLDVAVDLVGANVVLAQTVGSLGRRGRAVMVGLSLDDVHLGPGLFFGVLGQSLLGHLGYDKKHLDDLVQLVRTGRLDVSGSISATMPLDDVVKGVEQLKTKRGNPIRLVVEPWS